MNLFGIKFGKDSSSKEELRTFNIDRDQATDIAVAEHMYPGAEFSSAHLGFLNTNDEYALIANYRELAASAEIDEALQEIRNEIFTFDVPDKKAVILDINTESSVTTAIAKKIVEEFNEIYEKIEFDHKGVQYFDDWYVDSKLYAYKIVDERNPKAGIQKIQIIDPLQIRKVKVIPRPDANGTFNAADIKEYYVFSNFDNTKYPVNNTINLQYGQNIAGLQISPDAIAYIHSGLYDRLIGRYVGYLRKAIIPYNNLKMMEDAMVIFRVVRAPSRRAIYIDVSGLQKNKAEEYLKKMMEKHRNKMTYNAQTGTLSDRRNVMSMLEDYWLPRRSEGKTTEIQNIEGQNANEILEEVNYNRDKLWRALGVPRGRFGDQPATFLFGKGVEIQRDEYRFKKFLNTLRSRFALFFEDLLKTQLILKRVIRQEDWEEIRKALIWTYAEDNAFVEYKETEIHKNRMDSLASMDAVVGKYYSRDWVAKNILRMTDEDIKEQKKLIEKERAEDIKNGIDPNAKPGEEGGEGYPHSDEPPAQMKPDASDDVEEQETLT